ncbi:MULTISPECIES: glycine oxidase ThiO [unclassified Mesorhizobium]|uniref:glycine oxidase ThiO n=2 Tax=Mesorhizobium TaxID=68287 RepID=UPI0013E3ED99|nr:MULTISPECIES: glycine oxidase ThiO [unclassified Mesorhizobium]
MRVAVIGAGVAGLACATELAERGAAVEVFERGAILGERSASRLAGAMLAPWCELESAEPKVARLGARAADWWAARVPGVARQGSLVLAPPRGQAELHRFARRTAHFEWVDADGIAGLEPDLAGRFRAGLLFAEEAHLCPRCAMKALVRRLEGMGVSFHFGRNGRNLPGGFHVTIDCRGFAARDLLPELRGVRGEMLLLRSGEITLSRPIRLLHPRIPVYVVPRGDGLYMVGATMVETDAEGPVTARSVMELLNAAYSLHPAFGEADIVETAAGVRPAFPDNLPRVHRQGATITINGLYRHGFLLAPAMARQAAELIFNRMQSSERAK